MKRYEFIKQNRKRFPVRRLCAMMRVSSSGYYAWRKRPVSQRARENAALMIEISDIHKKSRESYGSPRVHKELLARGHRLSRHRVARLMRHGNIVAKQKRKRKITTNSRHNYPVAPNLLDRNFTAEGPNKKWVTDITYIRTAEGWLYLAVVMDLFSRMIVGWAMDATMSAALVKRAFEMAVSRRKPPKGLLHHSDRGTQYASELYRSLLADYHVRVSMSRTGNCYDNAVAESFFSTLKREQVDEQDYLTRQQAKTDIFRYIEGFYNPERRHSTLDYLSPAQFEQRYYNSP
jgi:putative transposase